MALGQDESLINERNARIVALGPPPSWWHPFRLRQWRRAYAAIMQTDVTTLGIVMRKYYSTEYAEQLATRQHPSFATTGKDRRE